MLLNWIDFTIIGIITLSALISIVRGFLKEAFSLATWIVAFWVAFQYFGYLTPLFAGHIESPTLRIIISFAVIFIVILIIGALLNHLLGHLVKKTGLSGTDRLLGVIFGVLRGGLLVAIIVLLARFTTLPQEPFWKKSVLVPHFEVMAQKLTEYLPDSIKKYIKEKS